MRRGIKVNETWSRIKCIERIGGNRTGVILARGSVLCKAIRIGGRRVLLRGPICYVHGFYETLIRRAGPFYSFHPFFSPSRCKVNWRSAARLLDLHEF